MKAERVVYLVGRKADIEVNLNLLFVEVGSQDACERCKSLPAPGARVSRFDLGLWPEGPLEFGHLPSPGKHSPGF